MSSVAHVATALQDVLTTVADQAARATGAVKRHRQFTGATLVQTLVFSALAHAQLTLIQMVHMAAVLEVAITPQAMAQRFTAATSACLEVVLAAAVRRLVTADPVAIPLLERFPGGVYLLDTSTIALPPELIARWPGCGNGAAPKVAALKLGVTLDVLHGTLTGPLLTPARAHDLRNPVTAMPLPPGALRLADLGFWSLPTLAQMHQDGVWFLSRLQAQTRVVLTDDPTGSLDHRLADSTRDRLDLAVQLGAKAKVPARLLAVRVPSQVAEERRRKIRADGKRRGHHPTQARLDRADWQLLVTNVPVDQLSVEEAVVLARARWQIECLFKLWKTHGRIDEVRSANPDRIMTELLAKLLAMVIQHWMTLLGAWGNRERSLIRAAAMIRDHTVPLATGLHRSTVHLEDALHILQRCLPHAGNIMHRKKHPSPSQLLTGTSPMPVT
jgi:hypothetical protein